MRRHPVVPIDEVLLEQLMVETVQRKLQTIGDAHLIEDIVQMVFDGLFADAGIYLAAREDG